MGSIFDLPDAPPALAVRRSDLNVLAAEFGRIAVQAGATVMRVYEAGPTARL